MLDVQEVLGPNHPQNTHPFPILHFSRSQSPAVNDYTGRPYAWQGEMADGSFIKPGTYVVRIAALRPFGDPTVQEVWDVFNAPEIKISLAEAAEPPATS